MKLFAYFEDMDSISILYNLEYVVYNRNCMISKRYRATALVIKDGKVLLVRDRHRNDYSMPGGGFNSGESTIEAAIREIREELRLRTLSAERLRYCDFEGQRAKHKVCLLEVEGTPHIDRKELSDFLWWDRKSDIKVQGHVNKILYEYSKRNTIL